MFRERELIQKQFELIYRSRPCVKINVINILPVTTDIFDAKIQISYYHFNMYKTEYDYRRVYFYTNEKGQRAIDYLGEQKSGVKTHLPPIYGYDERYAFKI